MPLVTSTSNYDTPFDLKTYPLQRGHSPRFLAPKFNTKGNVYTEIARRERPRQIDPYSFPQGGLADADVDAYDNALGDIGIPALDAIIKDANKKIDRLVLATEIGTVAGVIGALGVLYLIARGSRR